MTQLRVQLVSWNGEKYISYLFASLRAQKFLNWDLAVLDNGSHDATLKKIQNECADLPVHATIVQKSENIGFAGGHNELFKQTLRDGVPYVLLLNQDMVLDPYFIEKLFYFMEAHPDCASASGRLMKWAFPEKTNIVDTLGLQALQNHRVIERGGGRVWHEDDDVEAAEVFGVSGALPVYRTRALAEVAFENEVFDGDFFSYKEDVDLAWRLRLAGWCAFTVLDAVAWHDRSASGPPTLTDAAAAANRKQKSAIANFYSYRNHVLMLIKNYWGASVAHELLPMLWFELKKAGYLSLTDRTVFWRGWRDIVRLFPRMIRKRAAIRATRRVSHADIAKWFTAV